MKKDFKPDPGSLWLVVVECIPQVVAVAVDGSGFFIPGQEPCWKFDHVQEWIRQVYPITSAVDDQNTQIAAKQICALLGCADETQLLWVRRYLQYTNPHKMADRDALLAMVDIIATDNDRLEAENRKLMAENRRLMNQSVFPVYHGQSHAPVAT